MEKITRAKLLLPVDEGNKDLIEASILLNQFHTKKDAGLIDTFLPNVLNLLSAYTGDYRVSQAIKLLKEYMSEKKADLLVEGVKLHWLYDYQKFEDGDTAVTFKIDLASFLAYYPEVSNKLASEAVSEVSGVFKGVLQAEFPATEVLFNSLGYPTVFYTLGGIKDPAVQYSIMNKVTEILDSEYSKALTKKFDTLRRRTEKAKEKYDKPKSVDYIL